MSKPVAPSGQHCGACPYLHKRQDHSGECGCYHVPLKRHVGLTVTEYYRDDACKADPRSPWKSLPKDPNT